MAGRTVGELHNTSRAAPEPMLVDRREAGRLLGVCGNTIDNLRRRGELPSVKIAARRLFDVADLRRFIEARKAVRVAADHATRTEGGAA